MKALLIAFGLLLMGFAGWSARMNAKAADWPEARGRILRSELRLNSESDNGDAVHIEYAYEVAGASYRGNTVTYAGMSNDRETKQALVDRYPVGREVTVYVDPAEPSRAVLERQASRGWVGVMAVGGFFVVMALFLRG